MNEIEGKVGVLSNSFSIQRFLNDQMVVPTQLLTSYKQLGLHEIDVIILLQIYRFQLEGYDFPTPQDISNVVTIPENQLLNHVRILIQKNLLEIKELRNEHNQYSEAYSLDPLWDKLFKEKKQEHTENHEGTIFILFEQEFGRPLSPFEIETINAWLDEDRMIPALIKAALRESVLMGKLNFKYIDRILREWKRKGIHTVEQARESSKSFRRQPVKKQYQTEEKDTSIYFNWLKGEE